MNSLALPFPPIILPVSKDLNLRSLGDLRENFWYVSKVKVKLSLWQAVNIHRVVRRRGSHIF
jgi:hypothetical protein